MRYIAAPVRAAELVTMIDDGEPVRFGQGRWFAATG